MDAQTRAIVLISPHNPTGSVLSKAEINSIVELANRYRIPIICDEVFSEFVFDQGKYPRPAACSTPWLCFTLNGISKMLALPGYKLSWIWVSGEDGPVADAVDALETTSDTFLSCGSAIQEVLPTLLANRHEFVRSYVQEVKARRDLAVSLLRQSPSFECVEPRGGFYMMVRVKECGFLDEEEWVIKLMEKTGVYVHPGYFYNYEKGMHFVISFLTKSDRMAKCLEKMNHFVRGV
jgi:aspartate/methionine/tyrosine aminotransferase